MRVYCFSFCLNLQAIQSGCGKYLGNNYVFTPAISWPSCIRNLYNRSLVDKEPLRVSCINVWAPTTCAAGDNKNEGGCASQEVTLPETNSSHLKVGHPKRKLISFPTIFRCYVRFTEIICPSNLVNGSKLSYNLYCNSLRNPFDQVMIVLVRAINRTLKSVKMLDSCRNLAKLSSVQVTKTFVFRDIRINIRKNTQTPVHLKG